MSLAPSRTGSVNMSADGSYLSLSADGSRAPSRSGSRAPSRSGSRAPSRSGSMAPSRSGYTKSGASVSAVPTRSGYTKTGASSSYAPSASGSMAPSRTGSMYTKTGSKYTKSGYQSGYSTMAPSKSGGATSQFKTWGPGNERSAMSGMMTKTGPGGQTQHWDPVSRTGMQSGYGGETVLPMEDPMIYVEEEEEKKCSTGCMILIILFSIIAIALLCWGGWYFFIRKENDGDKITTGGKITTTTTGGGKRDPSQGRWEYQETDGNWYNYGPISAKAIEECYQSHCVSQKSQTVDISPVPGYDYTVQVNSKTDIKQAPKGNGNFRQVRRNSKVSGGKMYQLWKFEEGASHKHYSPAASRTINKQIAAGKKNFIMDTDGNLYQSAPSDHGQKIIIKIDLTTMKQSSLGNSSKQRTIVKADPQ